MPDTDCTIVYDLYAASPPQGVNRSKLTLSEMEARLDVFFDDPQGPGEFAMSFEFSGVVLAIGALFPAPDGVVSDGLKESLGRLVQLKKSGLANKFSAYRSQRVALPKTLHYQLILMEEGMRYDIFAENVAVPPRR